MAAEILLLQAISNCSISSLLLFSGAMTSVKELVMIVTCSARQSRASDCLDSKM